MVRHILSLALLLAAGSSPAHGGWPIELEGGAVFSGYNDVQIPNETGTRISLTDDLGTDAAPFARARLTAVLAGRHVISLLVAPLRLTADGSVGTAVRFHGEEFPAGEPLEALYRFDSYRLTYRYRFHRGERFNAGLGLTAKIRDAAVRLGGAGLEAEYTNTGFVPLLNFRLQWTFAERLSLVFEGDALASPGGQGRAEDVLTAVRYDRDRIGLALGYRLLEGGADVEDVYSFAMLHYLAAGVSFTF